MGIRNRHVDVKPKPKAKKRKKAAPKEPTTED